MRVRGGEHAGLITDGQVLCGVGGVVVAVFLGV